MNFYSSCEYNKFPTSNFIKVSIIELGYTFIGRFYHGVIEGEGEVKVLHTLISPAHNWNNIDFVYWNKLVDKKALWEPVSKNELMAYL